jgi:hypothetical protein
MLGQGCAGRGIARVTVGTWLSTGGQHHELLLVTVGTLEQMARAFLGEELLLP